MRNSDDSPKTDIRALPERIFFSREDGTRELGFCEWDSEGSIAKEGEDGAIELDLTGSSVTNSLRVTNPEKVFSESQANWGTEIFRQLMHDVRQLKLTPEVCGTCKFFRGSGMIMQWSFGFESYCKVDPSISEPVFANIFARCDQWEKSEKPHIK